MIKKKYYREVFGFMASNTTSQSTLYGQIRTMLLLGIILTLLLSLGASFALSLSQESRARDQALISAAQVAANAPTLMDEFDAGQIAGYSRRTVVKVSNVDVFAVYDRNGKAIAFYDLASGSDDPSALQPLSKHVMNYFSGGEDTLLYNGEAPLGTDRCA